VVVRGDCEERRQRPRHCDEGAEMGAQRGLLFFCGRGTGRMGMEKSEDEYLGRRSWSWGAVVVAEALARQRKDTGHGRRQPASLGRSGRPRPGGRPGAEEELSSRADAGICLVHGGRTRGGRLGGGLVWAAARVLDTEHGRSAGVHACEAEEGRSKRRFGRAVGSTGEDNATTGP
jgi:hypothetical protein